MIKNLYNLFLQIMATIAYVNKRTGKAMMAFEQSEAKQALSEFCFWSHTQKRLKKIGSDMEVDDLAKECLAEAKLLLNIQKNGSPKKQLTK